jgi:hypothetical protein
MSPTLGAYMKLKTLKTYQSVRFNTKDETHFDSRIPRFEGIEMEYDVSNAVVYVKLAGKDSVIIFPTNIAYAVIDDSVAVLKAESKKAK